MPSRVATLLFVLYPFTASVAAAQDYSVTLRGTVSAIVNSPGAPFGNATVGDAVVLQLGVINSPTMTVVAGGVEWEYPLTTSGNQLSIGTDSAPFGANVSGFVRLVAGNIGMPPPDAVSFSASTQGVMNGFGILGAVNDPTGTMFAAPDISQTAGSAHPVTSLTPALVQVLTGALFVDMTEIRFNSPTCSSIGSNACAANPNSTGEAARMRACGSVSLAQNDVLIESTRMPPQAFGFFLVSRTSAFVPNAGGSAGNLCLGGSIGRYVGPGQIQNSGASGLFQLAVDTSQLPTPNGPVAAVAGETWYFTCWFRDTTSGGGVTSNFADRLQLTFE